MGAPGGLRSVRTVVCVHLNLVAALALAGHEVEAHDALQNYLAVSNWPQDDGGVEGGLWQCCGAFQDPRVLDSYDREIDGLRKAGMPEE